MAATIITPADLAEEIGTTAKICRKFLRDNARENGMEIPGKGSRWAIEKKSVRSLKAKFAKWNAAQESARAERAAKRAENAQESAAAVSDEILDDENEISFDDLENPLDA